MSYQIFPTRKILPTSMSSWYSDLDELSKAWHPELSKGVRYGGEQALRPSVHSEGTVSTLGPHLKVP